jgi:hypothetical protein
VWRAAQTHMQRHDQVCLDAKAAAIYQQHAMLQIKMHITSNPGWHSPRKSCMPHHDVSLQVGSTTASRTNSNPNGWQIEEEVSWPPNANMHNAARSLSKRRIWPHNDIGVSSTAAASSCGHNCVQPSIHVV